MDQKSYDVIIVGAGPAGSTAAKFIAEEGYKVLLIDRAKFPRNKPCGGALTRRVIERFPYIAAILRNLLTSEEIFDGKIYSPSLKYSAEIVSKEPLGFMVFRDEFDNELVKIAKNAGAEFWDNYHISDVIFNKNSIIIRSESGSEVKCKVIIGADGVRSLIAKKSGLNLRWNPDQLGICILKEFDINEHNIKHLQKHKRGIHIHIGFENLYGYAWTFFKKNRINIGVGCLLSEKKDNLKDVYHKYIALLNQEGIIPDLKIENLKGALIPLKLPLKKTYGNNVILIGDAAGFVNSLSGEGLYYALSSGEIAAKTCMEILKKGHSFSEKNLRYYQKSWLKDFGKELKSILFLRRFTRIWLEGIIKYAHLDEKWKNMIINVILGFKKISKLTLARRYMWCRFKFWVKDMFFAVIDAISYIFNIYHSWGARTLNQFVTGFENLMIQIATFGKRWLSLSQIKKKEIRIWEEIYETIENPKKNKEKNILFYVFSRFKLVLNKFVEKLRISINTF